MTVSPHAGRASAAPLHAALHRCRSGLLGVAGFSAAANVLLLVAPVYMLQIYDRVLPSASHATLIALTGVAVFLLSCFGLLDWVRQRLMTRVALTLHDGAVDAVLAGTYHASLRRARQSGGQPVRDLTTVRQFLNTPSTLAFFDAPWAPVFLTVIFLIHPWLGVLALCSTVTLLLLGMLTETRSRGPYRTAGEQAADAQRFAENGLRHADVLAAMGMYGAFRRRWHRRHDKSVAAYAEGGARLSALLATTKTVRQTVQVGTLGLGAWLVLAQEITPGMMIAASIILSRALAPIEQGIAAWRGCVTARTAWDRLHTLIHRTPPLEEQGTTLPRPTGLVQVEGVIAVPPGANRPVLHDVSFTLRPGTVTAVVGPSGSGKSTLARVLVGVWPAQAGQVRLDGAAIGEWPAERRLQHVGYLPQEVELFEGSLAENVARLGEPDDAAVLAAARLAHCHDVLMRLPEHYDTAIAEGGANLSAGQRQRVGLARAVYGDPVFVVLDEPDANLDAEGEAALLKTLQALAQRKATVVVVTHTPRLLRGVEQVVVLQEGRVVDGGPREAVLQRLVRPAQPSVRRRTG